MTRTQSNFLFLILTLFQFKPCIVLAFSPIAISPLISTRIHRHRVPMIFMSPGFGKSSSTTSSSSSNTSSKALAKLKPKAQWDRYLEMKKSTPIYVAVRVVRTTGTSDWLEVGFIKSEDDSHTVIAVVAQRALIADHAKRLYPLLISSKDKIEWAYSSSSPTTEDGEVLVWNLLEKDFIKEALTTGMERKIGFEGKPDPASGFYCHYVDGRLE